MNRLVLLAAVTAIMVATGNKATAANANAAICDAGAKPCQAGCYLHELDKVCFPSPRGYYSPAADNNVYICPAGSFSEPGSSRCTPCSPGTASWAEGFGSCFLCGPGTYAGEGATTCLRCNAALYRGPGSPGIYNDGSSTFCLDPRSMPSPSPTVSFVPSESPSSMPSISWAPSNDPSPLKSIMPTKTAIPSLPPTGIVSVEPSPHPTFPPSTMSPTRDPTPVAATTTSPIRPTVRFPSIRGNESNDNQKTPPSKPTEIRNKNFAEAARDYLPLMVVAALLFVIGYLYRKIKPRKKRRPHRTVPPPPPPRLGQEPTNSTIVTDVDAAPRKPAKATKLVPKRTNTAEK